MTGHSTQLERMTANADWMRVAGDMTMLANMWARRKDLGVYLGRDGGKEAKAPAFFNPKTGQIEINSELAFGKGSDGSTVGDLTKRAELSKYPVAGGMVLHESGHARFEQGDWEEISKRFGRKRSAWDVYVNLEETRIEGRMAIAWPKDVGYLRACTRHIVIGDRESWSSPRLAAVLVIGRHQVGILEQADVAPVESFLLSNGWNTGILTRLREIVKEYLMLDDVGRDLDRQVELAEELDRIMPPDPRNPAQDFLDELMDALADAIESAEAGGMMDAIREGEAEAEADRRDEERQRADTAAKNEQKAKETFKDSSGHSAGVPWQLIGARPPYPAERGAAVALARELEKAKYRDRASTEYDSEVPPGRFNGGEAMRMSAARAMGGDTSRFKPFRHVRWQETDEPPLSVGIMSDVSGSMSAVQEAVGVANYVISEAVSRLDKATAAAVYFGEKVHPGLRKGERLTKVRTWNGRDGWENFDDGFRALDGELTLLNGHGARLLIVVSDGQYGAKPPYQRVDQAAARDRWIDTCVKNRVGVVWLQLRGQHAPVAERPGVEVITVGTNFLDAVEPIGRACVRALSHASG